MTDKIVKAKYKNADEYIKNAVKSVRTSAGMLHNAAYIGFEDMLKANNSTRANNLIEGLREKRNIARVNALIKWFEAFANLKYDKDSKKLVYVGKDSAKEYDAETAWNTYFWAFKATEGVEYQGFDLMANVEALAARALLKAANMKDQDKIDFAALDILLHLAPKASEGYVVVRNEEKAIINVNKIGKAKKAA
jgi:hypothetical protein